MKIKTKFTVDTKGTIKKVGRDVFEYEELFNLSNEEIDLYDLAVLAYNLKGYDLQMYDDDYAWQSTNTFPQSKDSYYRVVPKKKKDKPTYEQIQAKWVKENDVIVCDTVPFSHWNWENYKYRVVPEPTYRPYTFEDFCKLGMYGKAIVQIKDNQIGYLRHDALGIYPMVINFESGLRCISYEELKDEYTWLDGSPCGAKI